MGKRGPKKGHGGRPRKSESSVAVRGDGYKRVTIGAKGKGTQVYAHRAKMGVALPKSTKGGSPVVDHKDGNRANNARANLRVVSRGANNRRSGKK